MRIAQVPRLHYIIGAWYRTRLDYLPPALFQRYLHSTVSIAITPVPFAAWCFGTFNDSKPASSFAEILSASTSMGSVKTRLKKPKRRSPISKCGRARASADAKDLRL